MFNTKINDLGYLRKDIELKIEGLQDSLEIRERLKLQSLILRTELDVLLLASEDSPAVLTDRQTELRELELVALNEIAKNVLSDSELQQKNQNWMSMDYDQLQAEQEFYVEKIHDSILVYQELAIANEQELTNELNNKELVLYLAPSFLIIGTIVSYIADYLEKKEGFDKKPAD